MPENHDFIIRIKDLSILNLDDKLEEIALEAMDHFLSLRMITSAYRPGDSGVHGQMPVRGLDFRCREDMLGRAIAKWVNERWIYDPDRPQKVVALYHDVGLGKHLHFQAHPGTVRREPGS